MATKITTRVLADDAVTDAKIADVTLTTATQSASDNTTKIATTAYVTTAIANLADSAPSTLNTLNELAAALGDDANYATTTTAAIAAKLPLAGGTMTGTLNITQASTADTIKLTRSTTAQNNMIKFASASADKWIVGQRNDSTEHFRFYSYGTSSDVLSIQTGGNVGIGTTTPGYPLNLFGAETGEGTAVGQLGIQSTTAYGSSPQAGITFTNEHTTGSQAIMGAVRVGKQNTTNGNYSGFMAFDTRTHGSVAAERMRIAADGTTTIGRAITTTYDNDNGYPLHIQASGGNQTYLAISLPGDNSGDTGLVIGHDATGSRILNREDEPIIFHRASGETMRIDGSGKVGIGNTNPGDYSADANNLVVGSLTGNNGLTILSNSNSAYGSIYFADDTTGNKVYAGFIRYQQNQSNLTFGTNEAERMRIDVSGRVGIGNTSPSRALLHVGGNGITLNTNLDVSKTAILRTSGTGNYSTSGNDSAAHALTLMRGSNAADGDQVGLSFVLDNGNWSATSEIMAEVEQASSANTRLNFKTWNATGSMRTTQYITSEGQVVKPYQSAFVAVRDQAQSIAVNQNVIFNNAYKNIGADYNTSTGSYTAPVSGFYFFSYTILIITTTTFHIDHYLRTSNHSFIGGMPGRIEYQAAGSGTWGDGYIGFGHAQTVYMDAGDTCHVDFSELGGATRTVYGNSGNNWTKFSGYFLG